MTADSTRRLADLPALLGARSATAPLSGRWTHVRYDSRSVESGDLFVAIRGETTDGHRYLDAARDRGAAAAVVEREVPAVDLPQIGVPSTRRALAQLAAEETGHPSRELIVVGITGTNGKTTTAHLLRAALESSGHRAGVMGTVGHAFEDDTITAPHTTPEAPELHRTFRRWRARGAEAVAIEVSSHALALDRTYGVAFDVGVFTNLTQDHLDFHGTLEAYRDAKARLFRRSERGDRTKRFTGVINLDDPAGPWMRGRADAPVLGFGRRAGAEVTAEDVRFEPARTRLRIRHPHGVQSVALRLRGEFNVSNALAAFAAATALGLPAASVAAGLEVVTHLPGRLEPVEEGQPFLVFVDYAHTPDALAKALQAVRSMKPRRLVCVFGCGGDRDRGKRPLMGAAAARHADLVFLTSDNPRTEDPTSILAEIAAGVPDEAKVRIEVDRTSAIHSAVRACEKGDALLIAGKGHETYQILGNRTIHFDDREVARRAVRERASL